MTIRAFEGGAGCGKTYRLIMTLSETLAQRPLLPGQKVLAITYMHGSRRRLNNRLRSLGMPYECATLDSVAFRVVARWQALAAHFGYPVPRETEYDAVCAVAATLLEFPEVANWLAAACPIVLIDEAQDLCATRLRIVQALADRTEILLAADEFQCLNQALRPNPCCSWLGSVTELEILTNPYRTSDQDLLAAAAALRSGGSPVSARSFQIKDAPREALAGTYLSNQIGWHRRGGTVAILTPTAPGYPMRAIAWATANRTKRGQGPHRIDLEQGEKEIATDIIGSLSLPDRCGLAEVHDAVQGIGVSSIATALREWLDVQQRARGRNEIDRTEIEDVIRRAASLRQRYGTVPSGKILAMTIHAAKNREFDGVVVLWPYAIGGDAEQKRRLLYNAVTRARRWCLVLLQGAQLRCQPPFT